MAARDIEMHAALTKIAEDIVTQVLPVFGPSLGIVVFTIDRESGAYGSAMFPAERENLVKLFRNAIEKLEADKGDLTHFNAITGETRKLD